jgi:hypothetical protein
VVSLYISTLLWYPCISNCFTWFMVQIVLHQYFSYYRHVFLLFYFAPLFHFPYIFILHHGSHQETCLHQS